MGRGRWTTGKARSETGERSGKRLFRIVGALTLAGASLAAAPAASAAQQGHEHRHGEEAGERTEGADSVAPSPYAGQEGRELKALSPEELRGLLGGEGMGLARAAELNGIPGPRHVLELAAALGLDADQRARVQGIFRRMREAAVALGREIVERERSLDRGFAAATVDSATVAAAARGIGELRGRLRGVHLTAHLATAKILTDAQIREYVRLRGYDLEGTEP